MPGGRAIRPGDVLHHPGGLSAEVTDTDSEGRLVLADCLAYLASASTGPASLIDVGTLTDVAGLGTGLWAVIGNNQRLIDQLLSARTNSGDRAWQLPFLKEYQELVRSPVADSVNCSRQAPDSAVLAGTYLGIFAGECPWVHIDKDRPPGWNSPSDPGPKGQRGRQRERSLTFSRQPVAEGMNLVRKANCSVVICISRTIGGVRTIHRAGTNRR